MHRPEVLELRAVLAASIGDFVWEDLNTNGIQEVGEPGIGSVTVQLLNSSNTVIGTTTTDGMGLYQFTGLSPGNYAVKVLPPVGYDFSPADQGSNDNLDSDYLVYAGRTAIFSLGLNETKTSIDIGLAQKFTVDIPDVTYVTTGMAQTGYVDVIFTNVPGGMFVDQLAAYNAGILLTPGPGSSSGVNLIHDAIEPANAIFPGQNPNDFTSSGNLQLIADNLSIPGDQYTILNNKGIFRLQFTIPANATGDYALTFDANNTLFFDALTNQLTNIDFSPGTIHLVPEVSITTVTPSANEGSSGATTRSFDITLSHASTQTITVLVNTVDGTATSADGDYTAIFNQLVTFAPGQVTQPINVAVNGDTKVELNEAFSVVISSPTNAVLQSTTAQTVLQNDDAATITVSSPSITEGNSGTSILNFTVALTQPVDEDVTVTISTAPGSATASDFTPNTITHTFLAGQTSFTFPVTIAGDLLNELNETFTVNLSSLSLSAPRDVSLGAAGTGTIINDDFDFAGPTITGVYIRSTGDATPSHVGAWQPSFLNRLIANNVGSSNGYRLDVGASQLDDLPWLNLNQISIQFNEDVVIDINDLKLRGVTVTDYTLSNFAYDSGTHIATWDVSSSSMTPIGIGRDKLLIQLSSDLINGVLDINGNALDGNSPSNNTAYPSYPSGDGTNGGDFKFRFDVLPGNTDRGVSPGTAGVFGGDVNRVRDAQFSSISNPAYPIFYDLDGSGTIFGNDVNNVRDRQFTNLPVGEPTEGSFLSFFSELGVAENEDQSTSNLMTNDSSGYSGTSAALAYSLQKIQPTDATLFWYSLGAHQDAPSLTTVTTGKKKVGIIN